MNAFLLKVVKELCITYTLKISFFGMIVQGNKRTKKS